MGGEEVRRAEDSQQGGGRRCAACFRACLRAKCCDHRRCDLRDIAQAHFAALAKQVEKAGFKMKREATPQAGYKVCGKHVRVAAPHGAGDNIALSKHSDTTLEAQEQPRQALLRIAVQCRGCFKHAQIMARTIGSSDMPRERACSTAESCMARVMRAAARAFREMRVVEQVAAARSN